MLYSNAAMSNLGQGYWECRRVEGTHTRDKVEKDSNFYRTIPATSFSPVFALRVAGNHARKTIISNATVRSQNGEGKREIRLI